MPSLSDLPITYIIIGFTVLISVRAFSDRTVFENMMFEPYVINARKDWFRLLTHGFIHGNYMHLAVNMFVLYMFGTQVESGYAAITGRSSTLPFLVLYLAGITLSSLPAYYKHRWNPNYRAVGASGATSAVIFASIMMYPTSKMGLLLIPVMIPAWLFGILYVTYEWYQGKRGNDGIAHDAHLAGAIVGLLFTAILHPSLIAQFFTAIQHPFS
jgi:membrane associated rhomboid family serine protease